MLSLVQTKKLTHLFNILDMDKNGVLQEKDFLNVGKNICVALDWQPNGLDYQDVMEKCRHIYKMIFTHVPHKEHDAITLDLWLHYFDFGLSIDEDMVINDIVSLFLNKVFEIFDQNHDGCITEDEYVNMFKIYGLDITYSEKGFESLDTDGNDKITKAELKDGLIEFFTSSNVEAKGNWAFGSWH